MVGISSLFHAACPAHHTLCMPIPLHDLMAPLFLPRSV
jgi:hypothetical protein